ncbi:(1-_4)-alpha-D-glucan 1-alpha-D-glucosylmutase [Rhizomicrobium palustre]|uniref:(1->4)-alpha-D-glucan 1-alpha-D-glucosylmutase n=1 Tax=Rhizomicrobium palustre TaxID=189966 RepID=A0A846N147_9PROT|nr:malto-oligosyltrehalose synthase [Rhizomicrobium palustre]NIK89209.1 (1->4)-alpha-D-glucan 1-alpha-D-glucosylmutase [Rhizomicrobium palustre]
MKPRATYRMQFHKAFTFSDAMKLVPYFAKLGISHLYASPILMARAGSMHGYDVVDHGRVNPELGGEEGFRALASALRQEGIGVLLDIVPNHMAVGGADNPYWLDVLEKGRDSIFANLFDIDWEPAQENLRDKILVPLLGKPVADCLTDGELTVVWDERLGKFAIAYSEHRFPLRKEDYEAVQGGGATPADADLSPFSEREALRALLERQNFRLAYWKSAGERINWRRFFDITSLAALRVEDDAVFEQIHATVFRLYSEGMIDGVRIDHVDGLYDPASYCRRLRARLEVMTPQRPDALPREPAIILVEKILAEHEDLAEDWQVDGTTGYDFMNLVSGLLHQPASESAFNQLWESVSGHSAAFDIEECRARKEMLEDAFASALRGAALAFQRLDDDGTVPVEIFSAALKAVLLHFHAYRTYARGDQPEPQPGRFFDAALAKALEDADENVKAALAIISHAMRGEEASGDPATAAEAVRRFNQLAAPVAAKAVEDTAFYRYGRLLSRNDVGFNAERFSISPQEFHEANAKRQAHFPYALLATATHDHKRGEDTRARLAVLSEIPDLWEAEVREWFALNAPLRPARVGGSDEYQLYQTLVACRPYGLSDEALSSFTRRILAWREKSLKEAKLETSWAHPDAAFEAEHAEFVRRILDPGHGFLQRLEKFSGAIAPAGALNGLVSMVLRCTSPGVPDIYQGTELWDLSLVDPDNRRPVDFHIRNEMLSSGEDFAGLIKEWRDGHVKLALLAKLLALRAAEPALFAGDYTAIETGDEKIFAFIREAEGKTMFVAVPRLCAKAAMERGLPLPDEALGDRFELPLALQKLRWQDGLEPGRVVAAPHRRALFTALPALVLIGENPSGVQETR